MLNTSRALDLLLKDEKYNIYNLSNRPYTADVVEHFCRYYWNRIESVGANGAGGDPFDEELLAVYLDLSTAISHLPGEEKEAIGYLLEGYSLYGKGNIASVTGVDDRTLRRRLRSAYAHISKELRD